MGIVHHGKMIRVGTVNEMLAESVGVATEVVAGGLPADFQIAGIPESTSSSAGQRIFLAPDANAVSRLLNGILTAQGSVASVTRRQPSLEDFVVQLIAKAGV